MTRERRKAFAGFMVPGSQTAIATGHWGCGAFGGDRYLKSLLQWIAASAAGRSLSYYTSLNKPEDAVFVSELKKLSTAAQHANKTCEDLWQALLKVVTKDGIRGERLQEALRCELDL